MSWCTRAACITVNGILFRVLSAATMDLRKRSSTRDREARGVWSKSLGT